MLIVLVQLPPVQAFIGSQAASALKDKFGTEVNIGKVNLGFLNRIIIDDVMMKDQQGDSHGNGADSGAATITGGTDRTRTACARQSGRAFPCRGMIISLCSTAYSGSSPRNPDP